MAAEDQGRCGTSQLAALVNEASPNESLGKRYSDSSMGPRVVMRLGEFCLVCVVHVVQVVGFVGATTVCPAASNSVMMPANPDASAKAPWTRTTVGESVTVRSSRIGVTV